jgi:hypothetical protein
MDTGVATIPDDKYATSSAEWLQVSRQEIAKYLHHITIYIYARVYVCVCVCVCVCGLYSAILSLETLNYCL